MCLDVSSDVWITTGGTVYNDVARSIGEAVAECTQDNTSTPTVIGFANLSNIENKDEVKRQSHNIRTVDQKVR